MKNLVLLMHGHNRGRKLSDNGRVRVVMTSEALADRLDGNSMLVFSSPAPPAIETAKIFADRFGVEFDTRDALWSGRPGKVRDPSADFHDALGIILAHDDEADTLVLVTDDRYGKEFPYYLEREYLETTLPFVEKVPLGTALVVDCIANDLVCVD